MLNSNKHPLISQYNNRIFIYPILQMFVIFRTLTKMTPHKIRSHLGHNEPVSFVDSDWLFIFDCNFASTASLPRTTTSALVGPS